MGLAGWVGGLDGLDERRASVFGGFAEEYERRRPGYPADAVDWLLPPGATRVVDVGAGTGKLTSPLLERGLQVVAVLTRLHPDAERKRLLDAHATVAEAESRRRGTPTVPLHQAAACVRRRPVPAGSERPVPQTHADQGDSRAAGPHNP